MGKEEGRAGLLGYDDKGSCVLVDATAKCLGAAYFAATVQ